MEMGIEPGRYIVGNELNSKNPVTGQPEFFLKKIIGQIRKAIPGDLEQYLGPIVGMATGNPFLGAIAGGIGSGAGGAIAGGLGGYRSPGIKGLGGGRFAFGGGKVDPVSLFGDDGIFSKAGAGRFFLGDEDKAGLFGKFDFRKGADTDSKTITDIAKDLAKEKGGDASYVDYINEASIISKDVNKAADAVMGGMSIMDAAKVFGLGTAGLGLLIKLTSDDGNVGNRRDPYKPTGEIYDRFLNPKMDFATDMPIVNYAKGGGVINQRPIFAQGRAEGGVMDLQDGGESVGPGTGTSDSIPAMLSDGEFVMTAKAVRGAGGGDRREGARKMYQAMDELEARA